MPLSRNAKLPHRTGPNFGYGVAAGAHVFAGSMLAIGPNNAVQPISAGGTLAFAGVSDRELDNTLSAGISSGFVVAERDVIVQIPVSATGTNTITGENLGQEVYALDDASCTLGSTSISGTTTLTLLAVGTLAGIENGTWVRINR